MNDDLMIATATDGAAAHFALSTAERQKCSRLPTAGGRRNFRAGRLAAKRAATTLVGCPPNSALEVRSNPDAPPTLTVIDGSGARRDAGVALSLSHRNGRAVAAAAPAGLHVGVDLERAGAVPCQLAHYFLKRSEMRLATHVDPTVLWSLKEAAWKALSLGRTTPFKALELCCDRSGALTAMRVHDALIPVRARLTTPWPGYHVAMVWLACAAA